MTRGMSLRSRDLPYGMTTIAGVPVAVSPMFLLVAFYVGWQYAGDVASTSLFRFTPAPTDPLKMVEWAEKSQAAAAAAAHPSRGWVLAAGLGVAAVYTLSVLAHELAHLAAARLAGADVDGVFLDFAGGFVVMADDDRLTAGKLAAIAGAGPLVTACLAAVALALAKLGVASQADGHVTSAGAMVGAVVSAALVINAAGLAINLLPFRVLDGGDLLAAARLWWRRR
jgi:Zn-dependent protease